MGLWIVYDCLDAMGWDGMNSGIDDRLLVQHKGWVLMYYGLDLHDGNGNELHVLISHQHPKLFFIFLRTSTFASAQRTIASCCTCSCRLKSSSFSGFPVIGKLQGLWIVLQDKVMIGWRWCCSNLVVPLPLSLTARRRRCERISDRRDACAFPALIVPSHTQQQWKY